ncbi:MAG: hypothetical protein JOZ77_08155 [Candidatus Eremiobacteraeota bacterium]|nr:hypothetical protein [Candidatus Eremiobacteraeota bacterium]
MHRLVAGALCLILALNTAGPALASAGDSAGRLDLVAFMSTLLSTVMSSSLYADVTGSSDRYAAMHAPPPIMRRPDHNLDAAGLMRAQHALKPRIRVGIRQTVLLPPRSALDPRHHRLDPLAMRRSPFKPESLPRDFAASVGTAAVLEPLRVLAAPVQQRRPQPLSPAGRGNNPMTSLTATTGIEPWWTYEERAIPGIGKAMVNVGTGNLIVSAMDVDVPEQGIDLAFQRVYNSQSLHDYNGDDGGDPAIFGNRWTNSFDASIVYNSIANTITVYDIDGAACVYTSNGQGSWLPCTGEYATLAPTDDTDCNYVWTKTNGTEYQFHADVSGAGCSIPQAKKGQLQQIIARNQINSINFVYSYNGQGKNSEDVTEIDADHSDGDSIIMKFGIVPGTSINELATITKSDGATLQYLYDSSGNLLEVDKPGNNSAQTIPNPPASLPQGDVPETYAYGPGTSTLQEACGPRCTVAMWNNPNNPKDGGALLFTSNSSLQLTSWQFDGVLNFTPSDGMSTILQSGYSTGFIAWFTANFVYGAGSACSNASSGTTAMCDSDGHGTNWAIDSSDRVTQTSDYTGTAEAQWIPTEQSWDTNNDLVSTTDANGNVTQYAYDTSGYNVGNLAEMQLPQVTDVAGGPLSPLSTYSYDQYHNVTSYCDPVYNQNNAIQWKASPGDSYCPGDNKTTILTYTQTTNEPFGCLTNLKKPSTYSTDITFAGGTDNCGLGLPTKVKATYPITQPGNSSRQPQQDFVYDSNGNLTSYDKGSDGTYMLDSWTLSYSKDNLNMERTENEPTINNAAINSFSCYYPDGTILFTETPSQHAADGNPNCPSIASLLAGPFTAPANATVYSYDTDDDQVQIVDHKGGATGTTTKFYDGLDRLIEAEMPQDAREMPNRSQTYDCYKFPWLTRYDYDLSMQGGGASLSIGSVSGVVAYGGLYKTQEYLPGTTPVQSCPAGNPQWTDVRGSAFDGLDRVIAKYELAFGNAPEMINAYDGSGELNLLSQTENTVQPGTHQTINYTYDNDAHVKEIDFSGASPVEDKRTYTFDADGRTATITTPTLGQETYTYDVDGNKTTQSDPAQENNASTITYTNYADGKREYLSISGGINKQQIFTYAYKQDGLLSYQAVNWQSSQGSFTWAYTPGGRELSETDPLTGGPPVTTKYWYYHSEYHQGSTTYTPKQYTYDKYGRASSLTFPEGYETSNMQYDDDDELSGVSNTSEDEYGVDQPPQAANNYILSARGELLSDIGCSSGCSGNDYTQSANGTLVDPAGLAADSNAAMSWDARSGMSLTNWWAPGLLLASGTNQYQYDRSGRQTEDTLTILNYQPFAYLRSYDAENHLIAAPTGDVCNSVDNIGCTYPNATLSWGPDGYLRGIAQSGNGNQNNDLHWDGDTLLFAGPGQPLLYIGKAGTTNGDGTYLVADRNQNGIAEAWHGPAAYGPWVNHNYNVSGESRYGFGVSLGINWGSCYVSSQSKGWASCAQAEAPAASDGLLVDFSREDGYSYSTYAVQGVRTYDSTSQQWTTPDAYAGDVNDPMSQKPFMWNDNNPVEWSDPSGYCTDPGAGEKPNGCLGGVDWNLNMQFGNALQAILSIVAVPGGEAGAGAKAAVAAGKVLDEEIAGAIMSITDTKLGNIANNLFRAADRLGGGTAGAVRNELAEGVETGGKWHLEKAETNVRAFENWIRLNSKTASPADLQAAKTLMNDLQDALNSAGHVPTIKQLYHQSFETP